MYRRYISENQNKETVFSGIHYEFKNTEEYTLASFLNETMDVYRNEGGTVIIIYNNIDYTITIRRGMIITPGAGIPWTLMNQKIKAVNAYGGFFIMNYIIDLSEEVGDEVPLRYEPILRMEG